MTPEERARQQIDLLLQQSSRIVQGRPQINLAAGRRKDWRQQSASKFLYQTTGIRLVGSSVHVTLEIEAEIPEGAPDNVVQTVTENSRTLKFTSNSGFETESSWLHSIYPQMLLEG
jgi:hypothetical protein